GGCSSVVPRTTTLDTPVPHGDRSTVTVTSGEVRGRKSATPEIDGNVDTSTMRKRRRVRLTPEVLVHVRRMSYVPNVELLGGSDVKSRILLGGVSVGAHESSFVDFTVGEPASDIGPDRFSGPGAPRRWPPPADVPFVSTKMKSLALSLVSTGTTEATPGVVSTSSALLQLPLLLPVQPPAGRRVHAYSMLNAISAG